MRSRILFTGILMLSVLAACGGGEVDTGLLGRFPQGYDAYMTLDPELTGIEDILRSVEDNLSDQALRDIEESEIPLDPFQWSQWVDEMGIEPGEIGVIGLSEDMDFLALFIPAGDGEKLRSFVEDAEGEAEFLQMDEYTVMVITWDSDDQIDELEEALAGAPLSEDEQYLQLIEKAYLSDAAFSCVFFEEVTEVPIGAFMTISNSETVLSLAVAVEDEELEQYSEMFGENLQSSSIMFPQNTMAAVRSTLDMEWLASEYGELAELSDTDVRDVESGLPFLGFESLEEFFGVFQGDYCFSLSEIELDNSGEPSGGAGIMAVSLTDSEKLSGSLSMVSSMSEAERGTEGDVTTFLIGEGSNRIWFFISNDVFYVTYNIEPGDVIHGIRAQDFFSGASAEGFMGGAADPEKLAAGVSMDEDTEDLIQDIFSENAQFSISFNENMAYSRITAGPDALDALVKLAVQMSE